MTHPTLDHRRHLRAQPLTSLDFASFGHVHELGQGGERRSHLIGAVEHGCEARNAQLWIANVARGVGECLIVEQLERHPFSAQTFIPLSDHPYLVIVCEADADGAPDLATLRGFRAHGQQGVTYRRNVWHAGLSVCGHGAQFVVSMSFTGRGDDDEFLALPVLIELSAPSAE